MNSVTNNYSFEEFSKNLEEFCQKSEKEENLKNLRQFIRTEHSLPDFKKKIHRFIQEKVTETKNDYFTRIIKSLLDNKFINDDKLYESFSTIDKKCSYTNFYGYAIIQTLSFKSIK